MFAHDAKLLMSMILRRGIVLTASKLAVHTQNLTRTKPTTKTISSSFAQTTTKTTQLGRKNT